MARGAEEKQAVISEILEKFEGSFEYGKEIRIPKTTANGETIEIKVTLTCAKENVGNYSTEETTSDKQEEKPNLAINTAEVSEEEIRNIERLVKNLNKQAFVDC